MVRAQALGWVQRAQAWLAERVRVRGLERGRVLEQARVLVLVLVLVLGLGQGLGQGQALRAPEAVRAAGALVVPARVAGLEWARAARLARGRVQQSALGWVLGQGQEREPVWVVALPSRLACPVPLLWVWGRPRWTLHACEQRSALAGQLAAWA